jgi:hypothetical protein
MNHFWCIAALAALIAAAYLMFMAKAAKKKEK